MDIINEPFCLFLHREQRLQQGEPLLHPGKYLQGFPLGLPKLRVLPIHIRVFSAQLSDKWGKTQNSILQGRGNDAACIGYEMAAVFVVPISLQNILHIPSAKGSWIHVILNVLFLSRCSLIKNVVRWGDYTFQKLPAYTLNLCMINHDSFLELLGETMKINMIYQHIFGTHHELEYSHFRIPLDTFTHTFSSNYKFSKIYLRLYFFHPFPPIYWYCQVVDSSTSPLTWCLIKS